MTGNFNAVGAMLGYLYQCRYALMRALQDARNNVGHSVSVEKFDDIAFDGDGSPLEMIQTKHHGQAGNPSDSSVDVWKTLNVWMEKVNGDPQSVADTKFVLITTGTASAGSALAKLRNLTDDRDALGAVQLLVTAAEGSSNKETKAARDAFLNMDKALRRLFVSNVWVFDMAPDIQDVRNGLEDLLFYAAPAEHIGAFVDNLEGWWFSRIVSALSDTANPSIPLLTIQAKVAELRESFQAINLPLNQAIDEMPPVTEIPDQRTFVLQMRSIDLSERATLAAVHDFYRAFEQRSRWARENLLVDGEVARYDRGLCDAWNRMFLAKLDEADTADEAGKRAVGRSVFHWASSVPKPLRNRHELWLSSGSYQILADTLRVGWHPDFETLLNSGANNE